MNTGGRAREQSLLSWGCWWPNSQHGADLTGLVWADQVGGAEGWDCKSHWAGRSREREWQPGHESLYTQMGKQCSP